MNQLHSTIFSFDIAFIQSETQWPNFVDAAHSFSGDVTFSVVGFLVLFSSLVFLGCSMCDIQSWEAPAAILFSFGRGKKQSTKKLASELPCSQCRYFNANRYLSCAVNPLQVLTAESKKCCEFEVEGRQTTQEMDLTTSR